ncbi:MAG: MFS transporter, partial [Pacificimonas sp.]
LFLYAAMGGVLVLLPYMLIRVADYSGLMAGAALTPFPIVMGLLSRTIGGLLEKVGARRLLTVGAGVTAVGLAMFARVGAEVDYWTVILPALTVMAVGMAIAVAPLTTTVMEAVDDDHAGTASGVNNAAARTAQMLAVALLGPVLGASVGDGFLDSFRLAALGAAGSAVIGGAAAWWLVAAKDDQEH